MGSPRVLVVAVGTVALCATASGCRRPAPPASSSGAEPIFRYEVDVASDLRTLDVEVAVPRGDWSSLGVEDGGERFLVGERVVRGDLGPEHRCTSPTCTLHYRFALADAAAALASADTALAVDGGIVSPPSTWLLHPRDGLDHPYALVVRGKIALGLAQTNGAYHGRSLELAPFAALGDFRLRSVPLGSSTLTLAIAATKFALADDALVAILGDAARPVADYFGTYPSTLLVIVPKTDDLEAKTLGGGGASIFLPVARDASEAKLRGAWVPTHEMIHVGFPDLGFPHQWLEEGMATYLEPLVRVRAGSLSADDRWRELVTSAPQGMPQAGDEGLESTHTWGRTYWGGALFCLSADVEIRVRTKGKKSLADAFRAIAAEHGSVAVKWDLERVLDVGDRATGVPVLREHYLRYGKSPGKIDFAELFRKLGVAVNGDVVTYDDKAELAWAR